jgi:hypothetical protein
LLLVCICLACKLVQAQQQQDERIKIFLNCTDTDCFQNYIISELTFFDFVRDRFQADVQVLIVQQTNAAAGQKFTLRFIGQKKFENLLDSATFNTKMSDTEADRREILLTTVKLGLSRFVFASAWRDKVIIDYPTRTEDELVLETDKWRNWVFTIGTDGNVDGESNRSSLNISTYLSIYKITPKAKFIFDTWYDFTRNKFKLDSLNISVPVRNYGAWTYYAHTLSEHWSAGIFGDIVHDEFRNIAIQHRVAPAIEYNIYPFSENTKRQLRIGYQVGYRHFKYAETTIFDLNSETRPYQQLSLVAIYTQPWGTINGTMQGRSFLDVFAQNRLTASVNLSLRLFEGFNLTMEGTSSIINDQISLSKQVASEEEFLLRGAQLPTNFLYQISFGFTFTFGSTNSSIVNPRFENIDD